MRKIERISISEADRERLQRLVRDRNTPQKVVWRARIVLLGADGLQAIAIATAVGKSVLTVRRWRGRYAAKGVEGLLKDATRPPRRKPLTAEKIKQVVHMTLHAKPADATHWSLSNMAAAAGLSRSSIQRIWSTHGLKPHLTETFKVSRDRNFAAKVRDVVGLYLDPPDKALVLCVDEKSQIQALDRTQPGLPMKKGRAGTMKSARRPCAPVFAGHSAAFTCQSCGAREPRNPPTSGGAMTNTGPTRRDLLFPET